MPVTIWDCHDSFWKNRRFVTWQLLRRNKFFQEEVNRCIKRSRSLFVPRRSYPPSSTAERFEFWHHAIELFAELLSQAGKIDEFKVRLAEKPIITSPPQPDQVPFRLWLESKELRKKLPYRDLFYGQLTRSNKPLPVNMMNALGFKLRHAPAAASPDSVLMTIRPKGVVLEISMPFHPRADGSLVIPLVDVTVDFPPPPYLPRFNQSPPEIDNRKAYAAYLYDQAHQPFQAGRGRPKNIKQALQVLELSKDGMKDSEIARSLFELHYSYPDKPQTLQRVHDLKVAARKAITAAFPDLTKKN
jgi:hypothetical protein